jgi:hypothetical protein
MQVEQLVANAMEKRSNLAEKSSSVKEKMTQPFEKSHSKRESSAEFDQQCRLHKKLKETSSLFFFASYDFSFTCHLLGLYYFLHPSIYLINYIDFSNNFLICMVWFGFSPVASWRESPLPQTILCI